MTYRELFYKATRLIDNDKITLGEYEEMTKPLDREVEQEPRKGHWLDTGWISECSCCHERSFPFDDSGYGSIYHNFCPNCGAKMESEE